MKIKDILPQLIAADPNADLICEIDYEAAQMVLNEQRAKPNRIDLDRNWFNTVYFKPEKIAPVGASAFELKIQLGRPVKAT